MLFEITLPKYPNSDEISRAYLMRQQQGKKEKCTSFSLLFLLLVLVQMGDLQQAHMKMRENGEESFTYAEE